MKLLFYGAIVGILLLSFGCLGLPGGQTNGTDTSNAITQQMCEQYRGHWGACDSGQCCNCGGIAGFGCPPGFVCTDYQPPGAADAMGICKKVSE